MHAHPRVLAPLLTALVLAGLACAGAEPREDRLAAPEPAQTEPGSYFWLPAVLGESVEVRESTPALIQCYHAEVNQHRDTVEAVTVELQVTDGRLRVRSAPLSERFGTCVDGVTVSWRSLPTDYGEGDLIPLTFGPER
jgi:hypothetical protein